VLAAIAVTDHDEHGSVQPLDELARRMQALVMRSRRRSPPVPRYPMHRGIVYRLLASYGLAADNAYV
jgi:hypothetical protein